MKGIINVMQMLAADIQTVLLHIQLEQAIFKEKSNEFHSAVAKTVDEAKALIETGFESVCTHEGLMLFRKRK